MSKGKSASAKMADNRPAELKRLDNSSQWAMRIQDIKPGDSIGYKQLSLDGKSKNVEWNFHREGGLDFKAVPYSDLTITDIKVTNKTVKVTGTFDNVVNKRTGTGHKAGEDLIRVTKTFKVGDIVMKRKPNNGR